MKSFKKVLALVLALTVMCSMSVTAFAESGSPSKIPMSKVKVVWTDVEKAYNGKVQHASYKVTYDGKTLKKGVDYEATWVDLGKNQCCRNPIAAKEHTNRLHLDGINKFTGEKEVGVHFTITKVKQTPISFKTKNTVKYKTVKKKNVYISKTYTPKKLGTKYNTGKVTCKKISGSSKLSVSKSGKIKVKKGTKKGTYKIKIKATAASTQNYKSGSTTKTVYVTVK